MMNMSNNGLSMCVKFNLGNNVIDGFTVFFSYIKTCIKWAEEIPIGAIMTRVPPSDLLDKNKSRSYQLFDS